MNSISQKKPSYKISKKLSDYLEGYGRQVELPFSYHDLLRFSETMPLMNKQGKDTLWETVHYQAAETAELSQKLVETYAKMKVEGDMSLMEHLFVDRIDFCPFGNSKPFRIRIKNHYNDNYDYYYVKIADASRVYGLELEHILSPNRINFIIHGNTLIEEHIIGIPGDQYILHHLHTDEVNYIRLAKEFIKFNERCFIRLLGDMRSYNFVIVVTPDFDDTQYRIRAIDFDQQCYEGKKTLYLPQFFKENYPFVELCVKYINKETIRQYQLEERTLMAKRLKLAHHRIDSLLDAMKQDEISKPEKIEQLKGELSIHYHNKDFTRCVRMGEIMQHSLEQLLVQGTESLPLG